MILEAAIEQFGLVVNISNWAKSLHHRAPGDEASFHISLAEIEAIASCFSPTTGKLSTVKFNQLFFPTDLEEMPEFVGLTKITDFKTQVYIDS